MKLETCNLCPALVKSRKRICWGENHTAYMEGTPEVMVIAEAPGMEEDKAGRPLIGSSGQEARHHLNINGISSHGIWLDNCVRCHPDFNRDPSSVEINTCTKTHLIPLIKSMKPKWVICMGRISAQWLLGPISLEFNHGIPRSVRLYGVDMVVIPTYHPAAGLHDPSLMILFQCDIQVAGDVIRGKITPHPPVDEWVGRESYHEIVDPDFDLRDFDVVAVDTEWARGNPYFLSFSVAPGESWVIRADHQAALDSLNAALNYGDTTTVIHNALYDLPVLAKMGIWPRKVADTMVMAYLLQNEPQGLKPLAFRHCGMEMSSYSEMVAPATRRLAMDYLSRVMEAEWPDPESVLEFKGGQPKVRQPQNIIKKVKRILADVEEKGADPSDRWKAIDEGKEIVEAVLGPMQEGELCDIDEDAAIQYSARDADATLRVYPILWERIQSLGLEETFWRDMGILPMIIDMMRNGMPTDVKAFRELSRYFQQRMDLIQRKMQINVGHHLDGAFINPASTPQMATLIYDKLRLQDEGGKFRSKKRAGDRSTADDILKRYIRLNPVIQDIIDWREYQKLKTSYSDTIPKRVGGDGRIRTTLRVTRTATGRLSSSNPNLMAQPTRSEEGRKIKDCFVAPEGMLLLECDYSQVEMRIAANDSKDERMMGIFWAGDDIHAITASEMFGVPISRLDEMKHRYPAKRVGFGILNLITAEGLQRELTVGGAGEWTVDDCKKMIKSWFEIYKGVATYMKSSGEQAKRYGYVRDMWGRIRYIPGIRSTNKWIRMEAERQAGNAPVQMGAQGMIKEAMGKLVSVYHGLSKIGRVDPLIQIHDSLVWLIDERLGEIARTEIGGVMRGVAPPDFIIPLEVDFKMGKKWGSLVKFY